MWTDFVLGMNSRDRSVNMWFSKIGTDLTVDKNLIGRDTISILYPVEADTVRNKDSVGTVGSKRMVFLT